MFDLSKYKFAIQIGAIVLLGILLMAGYLRLISYHEDVGYQRATNVCVADKLKAEQAQNQREDELKYQLRKANYDAEQRQAALADDIADLTRQLERVRNERNAMRARVAELSAEAARRVADAGIELLGECETEYGRVATATDQCLSDRQTMIDSWPK